MTKIDIVNTFISEAASLQEQITATNRLVHEFRVSKNLEEFDMKGFKMVAEMVKLSSEKLNDALATLEEESDEQ